MNKLISISSARPAISFGWPCPIGKVSQRIEQPLVGVGGAINPDGSKIAMQTWIIPSLVDSHPIQS